jgi:hypothetical protein
MYRLVAGMAALSFSLSSSFQAEMDQPTLELCAALSQRTESQLAVGDPSAEAAAGENRRLGSNLTKIRVSA